MKIDLTCPVELWQYALPAGPDAECTFVLNNLSDKVVASVQVTLNCFDQDGGLLFKQTERMQGLAAGVGERFTIVVLPMEWNSVESIDLIIEKVWFDDATIWRRGSAQLTFYTPNVLQPGRALDELRFVAGKDAAGYPQIQESVWMCVCGRPNAPQSERCCRCERRRDAVFASFSRENVSHIIAAHEQKLAAAARKAREENNILQENQEKQRAAKRRCRKLAVRWLTTLAMLAACAVVIVLWGIPTVRYNTAADLLANGHFDQASEAFAQMGDYRDAQQQMLECDYQKAAALHALGDAESMEQAETLYRALAEYADSAHRASQTAYDLGCLYLESASYEAAAEKFQLLGSFEDSADKLNETVYRQAKNMLDENSFEAARVLFGSLGAYSDAVVMMDECTYRMAEEKLEAGEYQAAISMFLTLGDYRDSASRVGECYYALAETKLEAGSYEQAGEWFLLAGGYLDAKERASESLYRLAQEKRENGEYEKAMTLFLRIADYEDSSEMALQCVYDQALGLMQKQDYAGAAALLESIMDFGDAQTQLDKCRFLQAQQAFDDGDPLQAERLLMMVADYKGLETQLKKVRYQLAETAMQAEDYSGAIKWYELLDGYQDSKTKINKCRYALAQAMQENGEYESAIALYTELNNYAQSRDKIKQCRYQLACQAADGQNFDLAIEIFEQLNGYEDSKTRLKEVRYLRAVALKENGETEAAMQELQGLGTDEAKSVLLTMQMEKAAQLEKAGDYAAAAEMYAAVEGSEEAQTLYLSCMYRAAESLRTAGDLPDAAEAFAKLGDYEDAAEKSRSCWSEYYGQVAQTAREAAQKQDHADVIAILRGFEMSTLSGEYSDLPELMTQACLAVGDQLYADGRPYEAIPYYQQANAKDKLERRAYLILGEWESATGKTAEFRMDGTCSLLGEELYFRVSNFSLYTGQTPETMTITHKISVLDKAGMSLRDQRSGGDVLYKLNRKEDFALPLMELPETSVEQSAAEMPAFEPVVTPEPQPVDENAEAENMLVMEEMDAENE